MADKSISELAVAQQMTDDALLVAYQNGETRSIEGQLIKQYARESTQQYVEGAVQSAKEAAESAESAKKYSGKPPLIQDGTWWTWNAESKVYEDTGKVSQGPKGAKSDKGAKGDTGPQGIQGETGYLLYATFSVDLVTGRLVMNTPDEYKGPSFALVDGRLEVTV